MKLSLRDRIFNRSLPQSLKLWRALVPTCEVRRKTALEVSRTPLGVEEMLDTWGSSRDAQAWMSMLRLLLFSSTKGPRAPASASSSPCFLTFGTFLVSQVPSVLCKFPAAEGKEDHREMTVPTGPVLWQH